MDEIIKNAVEINTQLHELNERMNKFNELRKQVLEKLAAQMQALKKRKENTIDIEKQYVATRLMLLNNSSVEINIVYIAQAFTVLHVDGYYESLKV
jgi:hypothetical protein